MIIKENTTPSPWYCKIKRDTENKELSYDQMLAVTGKCLCKCLIIYVNLPNKSSLRKKQVPKNDKTSSYQNKKSLIDMFLFSQGEDEKINARRYWKVLRCNSEKR